MRILFTQHALGEQRGGTELFTLEVVTELARRGHKITVYAGEVGSMASALERNGITVVDDPRKCPWQPDIIHGQHRMHALKGLMAFPTRPGILYLHGFLPLLEKPFLHPRIHRYVAISKGIADRWSEGLAIPREKFEIIQNHIDLKRFSSIRNPLEKPKKALLYSNHRFTPGQLSEIEQSCRHCGMTFEMAGLCTGTEVANPENLLPDYDLVFAVGRSAMEAAACGCAVIPVFANMAEELLSPTNYERLIAQNLSVRVLLHERLTASWLIAQINNWNRESLQWITRKIRAEKKLENTVYRLESVYRSVLEESENSTLPGMDDEFNAIATCMLKESRILEKENTKRLKTLLPQFEWMEKRLEWMEKRLEWMSGTMSWKITAPLREILNLLNKLDSLQYTNSIQRLKTLMDKFSK